MPQRYDNIVSDFETVVLRNKSAQTKLAAKRAGKTETVKKNPMSAEAIKMAKLDNDMETTKVKTVTKKFSAAMRDARTAKSFTQKDLANPLSLTVADIQKYENGTAVQISSKFQKFSVFLV